MIKEKLEVNSVCYSFISQLLGIYSVYNTIITGWLCRRSGWRRPQRIYSPYRENRCVPIQHQPKGPPKKMLPQERNK